MQELRRDQESSGEEISRLKTQFAADYDKFGQSAKFTHEQLEAVSQKLDAQHSNLTKAHILQSFKQYLQKISQVSMNMLVAKPENDTTSSCSGKEKIISGDRQWRL